MSAKRKRESDDEEAGTPSKSRAINGGPVGDAQLLETPTKRKRGRPLGSTTKPKAPGDLIEATTPKGRKSALNTPKSHRRVLFSTPVKPVSDGPNGTPTIVRNADRSARRKSAKRLIEQTMRGEESDEEIADEENLLAQKIWAADAEEEDEEDGEEGVDVEAAVPQTPSKRGRGRPKGSTNKKRTPSPPPSTLPPNEQYFWQNRPGGIKTSNNTLTARRLLNHEEYFTQLRAYEERHQTEEEFLLALHSSSFEQWSFELQEGFNICLYGYGSKRNITTNFATHLYNSVAPLETTTKTASRSKSNTSPIIIINGYSTTISLRDILTTVAQAVIPPTTKVPLQPSSLLSAILTHLSSLPATRGPIHLIINSIDGPLLRRHPVPTYLAALAAHPRISLLATADTPNFPLLWDLGLRAQFHFLFHDATTFTPYNAAELDAVETVNILLGRSGRRVGGRDGVGFVLRSLPENARSLFRILVAEQLALMDETGGSGHDHQILDTDFSTGGAAAAATDQAAVAAAAAAVGAVEYRVLYHKAVEEFVCSNEVGFRTLLKEFHDHQMVESRKDAFGTERLVVPFRREELEGLVEDLVG